MKDCGVMLEICMMCLILLLLVCACVGCGGKEEIDERGGKEQVQSYCPLHLGGSQVPVYA